MGTSLDNAPNEAQVGQRLFVRAAQSTTQTFDPDCGQGDKAATTSGCPVVGVGGLREADCPVISPDFDPRNMMRSTSNRPSGDQKAGLGTERVASSIPTAADSKLSHQPDKDSQVWMYPSEQMFYNAMKRKGWQPNERDMHSVVNIHNAVNERAWSEVLMWERLHCNKCKEVKLKKFMGRPTDYSPKSRLLHLLGYKLPFDRHDWVVSRCGQDVRYVIDFYNAAPLPGMPVALHLDVRPALDSFEALWDRLKVQSRWTLSRQWLAE